MPLLCWQIKAGREAWAGNESTFDHLFARSLGLTESEYQELTERETTQ